MASYPSGRSSPEGTGDCAGRVDLESLAGSASAERALDDIRPAADDSGHQPPIDLTAAAFFDVDNTLVQGSSAVHFGRGLAARDYFTYRDVLGFIYAQAKFQLLGKENSDDVAAGRRKALAFIEGRSVEQLIALGEEIYDEIIADKIWSGTRELTQMHLDAGQQVWLITATPYELAATIARRLGDRAQGAGRSTGYSPAGSSGRSCTEPARPTRCGRWQSARDSTSSAAPRTQTASTMYPCCRW
ncbi:haloacid dehalogenase-like hydrolase [Mycobacterium riyadhense]